MVFNKRINNSLIISYVVKDDDDWQTTFPCWTGRTFESWVCPKAESRLRRGGHTRPSLLTGEKRISKSLKMTIIIIILTMIMRTNIHGGCWLRFINKYHCYWYISVTVWTYMRLQMIIIFNIATCSWLWVGVYHHHHVHFGKIWMGGLGVRC